MQQGLIGLWPLLLPLLLATGCWQSFWSDPNSQLPPCASDDCNCSDFESQDLAQRVLDANPQDPHLLDSDGNGWACEQLPPTQPTPPAATYFSTHPHLLLGNPSHADKRQLDNYLIERSQYVLAYDRNRGTLKWASWQVNPDWLGQSGRQDNFRVDGSLPAGTYQVRPEDYRGSGYDRGHMVPSADRTETVKDNSATFLMSNIFPQAQANNRGPWRELENDARDWVYQQGKSLYIIGGIYGQADRLAKGRLVAPGRVWKVIVLFDDAPSLAAVTPETQVIAVDMPNRDGVDDRWETYRTSIDRIELVTGYDLLSEVPEAIQAQLEARP